MSNQTWSDDAPGASQHQALTEELYALMCGRDGATADAIATKSQLMSLRSFRADPFALDGPDPPPAVRASLIRDLVTAATFDLVKAPQDREHVDDTDLGAAARCFLGIERGTESLPINGRRLEAALYTGRDIRTMAKTQHSPPRMSHEHRLMAALAYKLIDRERSYLYQAGAQRGAGLHHPAGEPWLSTVHDVWEIASHLYRHLDLCYGYMLRPPRGGVYAAEVESLAAFRRLMRLVELPVEDDAYRSYQYALHDARRHDVHPKQSISHLQYGSPFDPDELQGLEDSVSPAASEFAVSGAHLRTWRSWLDSCPCGERPPPDPSCRVHSFLDTTLAYVRQLDACWRELRDPYVDLVAYKADRTPAEILTWYCVALPLDKRSEAKV